MRERDIFIEAIQCRDAEERAALLEDRCGDDKSLRDSVEELLASNQADKSFFLDEPPPGIDVASPSAASAGQSIGPYIIREQIGEGGMGVVYVAEQTEPVQRKVALKIIKPGMDTKEVIARFEAERQALAFMEHPNIARVLDAGATESGRSYFVMELVRGIPITEYCDQVKTTPRERLELFMTVCDAVQHAHLKGIIHRDIKPSNVLVTQANGNPVVKVIDFGLAKATSGQRLTDKTLYTGFMRLMGTPVYMSPEQAGLSSQDVDTRSDTYSLGVLLYELLTGTTPLDKSEVAKQAYDEWCRQIREVEPPKPSTRFSTLKAADRSKVAQLRQVDANSLRQMLDGDLDRVVLKALEKDRDRRYSSPRELALDVERFLEDKPVHAVPPSAWYLARKYVRRHKVAILTAVLFLSFLMLATAFSSWQAIRATKASRIADEKSDAALASEQRALKSERLALTAQRETQEALHATGLARNEAEQASEQRRKLLYAANMQLADHLWHSEVATPRQIQKLLTDWIPTDGKPDSREFAWRYQWTRLHFGAERTVNKIDTVTVSPRGSLVVADASGIREWDDSTGSFVARWKGDASASGEQVALSACGRWAAIGNRISTRPTIRLIEIETGRVIREVGGNRARFANGGNHVLVWRDEAGKRDRYEIWNVETGTSRSLENLRYGFESVGSISPDGNSFSFGIDQNTIELHVAGRSNSFLLPAEQYGATTWSPNGQLFVTGHSAGGMVYIRRVDAPEDRLAFSTGRLDICSVAISADSRRLAIGGDGTVDLYDIAHLYRADNDADGADTKVSLIEPPKLVGSLHAHIGDVDRIVFSHDGKSIATHDEKGTAKLWDLSNLTNSYPIDPAIEFPNAGSPGLRVKDVDGEVHVSHLPPDGTIIDGDLRVGDRIVGVEGNRGLQHVDSATDAHDVDRMLTGEPGSEVKLHVADASTQEDRVIQMRRVLHATHQRSFGSMAFTGNRDEIAVTSGHGALSRTLQGQLNHFYPGNPSVLSVSPDRRLLVLVESKELILWDLQKNKLHRRLPAKVGVHPTPKFSCYGVVSFSPNGKYMAMGTGQYRNAVWQRRSDVRVWNASTLKEIGAPLFENSRGNSAIAFSPDSKFMIVGDHNGTLRIWRTTDWALEETREMGGIFNTLSVDVSPDSRFIAQGGYQGLVIWDFPTRTKRHVLRNISITDVDFSPDGRTVIATLLDAKGKVGMWDADTGMQLCTANTGEAKAFDFELSPDGSSLAVLGRDGTIWMGDVASMEQIERHPSYITALIDRGVTQFTDKQFSAAEATLRRVLRAQVETISDRVDIEYTRMHLLDSIKEQGKLPVITKQPKTQGVQLGEPAELSVDATIANTDQALSYQWFFGGKPIEDATGSTFAIPEVTAAQIGRYHAEVRFGPTDLNLGIESFGAFMADSSNPIAKGGLKYETYLEIGGTNVSDLTASRKFPDQPNEAGSIENFELPTNIGGNYGARISGYLVPPKSGEYVFYICSDDSSELLLSSDELPENISPIAHLDGWHKPAAWESLKSDNISKPIRLEAGKRYWVEAHYKEGGGDDHFAVTWQMPDKPPPKNGAPPISGEFFEFQLE